MTKRPLLLALLTAAVTVTAMNLLISAWSHRLPYRKKLEEIRTAHDPNLLFLGNSLLDGHVDESALAAAAAERGVYFAPVNAAVTASGPPEHQLLFNYAFKLHPSVHTLVVGFFDFQLTKPSFNRVTDLTGNRMIAVDRRFPMTEVVSAYGFGALECAQLELIRTLPMAANRANAWKYVELLRRAMGAMGMPHVATNSMGRAEDLELLEAGEPPAFDAQARTFIDRPIRFNRTYENIVDQAERAGMTIVFVVMPMSPWHRQAYYARPLWRQYLEALTEMAGRRGIRIIDASDWFPNQQDFVDHLHMAQEAKNPFSVRLGDELTKPR